MDDKNTSTPKYQDRVVRIFVSSTFRDMHAERDELVKFTFMELRRRCRERQVELVEVDLRWGITDEQASEGKVLPICLAEIHRTRPYFIGMLGERYGWVPDKIPHALIEKMPWLKEHRNPSVTELEILHGVLNNPDMAEHAFFYFRDPETSKKVEAELAKKPDYQPETEGLRKKLDALKERIAVSRFPILKDYPDPETLGKQVLEDLWGAIDKRFPLEEVPTALERERRDHEAFAAARRKVYIGREEYFHRLDKHVATDGSPLVVIGESGSGKSALIANWAERYQKAHPDDFMVLHFIGGTADSADYVRILRRIMEEIKERYEPKRKEERKEQPQSSASIAGGKEGEEIPIDPKKVVEQFPIWLAKASARGRLVLVLDALNQLEDRDNARDLGWLPGYFPPNVRVILSALPGRSLKALEERELPELQVELLNPGERKELITGYLAQFTRTLSPHLVEAIATAEQTANPLYMKALLDELRVYGDHATLAFQIQYYLKATRVDELYERILERYEKDYEREEEQKGMVCKAMSLLWATRRGLSEAELLEILGKDSDPMPRAYWSPLFLAAEESLVSRSGLLNFFHDFLRNAIENRYLKTDELKRAVHRQLAGYFEKRVIDERKVDELPWQLQKAEQWEGLKDCITDMDMFLSMNTEAKKYELMGYWLTLGDRYDMVECYNESLTCYERTETSEVAVAYCFHEVAFFLHLNSRYEVAEPFYRRALEIREQLLGMEHPSTTLNLNNLAGLLDNKGDYEGAEPLYRKVIEIREKVLGREHPDTALSINGLAVLLYNKGDYEVSESFYHRVLDIHERILGENHPYTATSLNNLAVLLYAKGDYVGAEQVSRRALDIRERILGKNHPDMAQSLNCLALLLQTKGDYAGAEPLYRRALDIYERALGMEHPDTATCLLWMATLLKTKGDYEGAESLFQKALDISERVLGKDHPYTAECLNGLATLLKTKEDYEGAEPLLRRALDISERVLGKDHPQTAKCLNSLAILLKTKGDYEGAEPLLRRSLDISERVLGKDHPNTATILGNLAALLESKAEYAAAVPFYQESIKIKEKVLGRYHQDMALAYNQLGILLRTLRRPEEAEVCQRFALEIDEKVRSPDDQKLPHRLNNLAIVLAMQNKTEEARRLLERAWKLKMVAHDITSVRIQFSRVITAMMGKEAYENYLGQMKSLFGLTELEYTDNVSAAWDIEPVITYIQSKIFPEESELLFLLVSAIEDRSKLPELDRFPVWKDQPAVPLDT